MSKIPYKDIADCDEDERIRQIGEQVINEELIVGFLTDDEPGKADRYIQKLQDRFPGIRVIGRGDGPTPGVVWVKVAPPPIDD